MKKIFLALTALIGFSTGAQASLMIEPYAGVILGTQKYTETSTFGGDDDTNKLNGTAFGLRLGYQFLIPYVALDYTSFSGTCENSNLKLDCSGSQIGGVVGASLPFIRPYAGAGFSNNLKIKANGTTQTEDVTHSGTYTKVGLGLGFIPIIHVNIEYIMDTYSKIEMGSYQKDDLFKSFESTKAMITISYPITF